MVICGYVLPVHIQILNSQVDMQTHKPEQTKINMNGFYMSKSAAQLLYSPIVV